MWRNQPNYDIMYGGDDVNKPFYKHTWFIVVMILVVLFIILPVSSTLSGSGPSDSGFRHQKDRFALPRRVKQCPKDQDIFAASRTMDRCSDTPITACKLRNKVIDPAEIAAFEANELARRSSIRC